MFRNFVKPAAYEKVSVREANGEGSESYSETSPNSGHVTVDDRQPQSFTTQGRASSHSTSKDMKILEMKTPESSHSKGMHTTSIFVNGSNAKSRSSASFKTPQSGNSQQQYENKQQEAMQYQQSVTVNNSATRNNFQRHSEEQKRPSGNIFDEQIGLSNGLTDMQIRQSRSILGAQKLLSRGPENDEQLRYNGSNEFQKHVSSGPFSERNRVTNDPLDEQKRLYNGFNEEAKKLPSGQADAHTRLSSDPTNKQTQQAGESNDDHNRAYNSSRGEKNRLSSSSFAHKHRPYTGENNDNQRLYAGHNNDQKRLYNGPDEQNRLYSSPKDVQNRSLSGFSRDPSQRSDQQSNSFTATSDQLQSTRTTSSEAQRSAPVSTITLKSGHPASSSAIEPNPATHEAGRAADLHRRGLYYQSQYNVVPPPPPLFESAFAGLRDIRNPSSIHEKQIVSVKGTVRGFKNRVRAGIATFWAQSEDKKQRSNQVYQSNMKSAADIALAIFQQPSAEQPKPARNYRQLEHGRIVVYGTSMSVVRETSERCRSVRRLLQNHMVRYEERDLYMSREYQQELRLRLVGEGISSIHLPHVFADGIHIGGAGELEKLNEAGELRGLLDHYQKVVVRFMCEKCGGYRFLPCEFCHGSKRSLLRNHFTEEFCALRCMHCDENGLRRCDRCADQQE